MIKEMIIIVGAVLIGASVTFRFATQMFGVSGARAALSSSGSELSAGDLPQRFPAC